MPPILENVDNCYRISSKVKTNKDGTPKMKNGVPQVRTFNVPNKALAKIQKLILKRILEKIPLPIYVIGCVKNRSSILNGALHKGNKYKFQTDLSNFFPSVSAEMVYEMFRTYNFSHDVAAKLTKLTTVKTPESLRGTCLPQGTSTSPYLANLVFQHVDKQFMQLIDERKLTYTRYVDDLTFSSNTCFKEAIPEIIKIINSNGYKISRKKTTYRCGRTIITGVDVGNNTIRPTQEFYEKGLQTLNENQKKGRNLYKSSVKEVNKIKNKIIKQRILLNN